MQALQSIPTAGATDAAKSTTQVLTLNNVEVIYDHVALALKGASIDMAQGGIGRAHV